MFDDISVWHVDQYSDNVLHQFQQHASKLRGKVRERAVVGAKDFWTRIGPVTAVRKLVRHGMTPEIKTPLSARAVVLADWVWSDLIDKADEYKVLIDPQSEYVTNGASALARTFDSVVIEAFDADAMAGPEGGSTVTFSSECAGDHVLNRAMTVADLIQASEDLNNSDVPESNRFIILPPSGFAQLFRESDSLNLTSVERADIKALVKGEIDYFMGFTFIRSTLLPSPAPGLRYGFAWHFDSIGLSISEDLTTKVSERADLSYSTQVEVSAGLGATRIQGNGVVRLLLNESD